MGREAKVKKWRDCRQCGATFIDLTAEQIMMHGFVCGFEQRTGIEIINMDVAKATSVEQTDEPLIVIP